MRLILAAYVRILAWRTRRWVLRLNRGKAVLGDETVADDLLYLKALAELDEEFPTAEPILRRTATSREISRSNDEASPPRPGSSNMALSHHSVTYDSLPTPTRILDIVEPHDIVLHFAPVTGRGAVRIENTLIGCSADNVGVLAKFSGWKLAEDSGCATRELQAFLWFPVKSQKITIARVAVPARVVVYCVIVSSSSSDVWLSSASLRSQFSPNPKFQQTIFQNLSNIPTSVRLLAPPAEEEDVLHLCFMNRLSQEQKVYVKLLADKS